MLAPAAGSIATTDAPAPSMRTTQNWILDPFQDTLFVIAAPVLVLLAALAAFRIFGAEAAARFIIVGHIVFTVAHHLPTFIRIYGDVELFKRFQWSFVLAPMVPLAFSACVLGYINYKRYPVEYFLYLYIMLALWDPWHFLRQHYGFMRIYDRPNAAPRHIAARMDLALSVAWFVYIMLASGAWLASMLGDIQSSVALPALSAMPEGAFGAVVELARDAAIATTFVYLGYLLWCRHHGYFISAAKVALCITTFGVMFIAYTPNEWMLGIAPLWTFKVGFAAVGIVHMTQYLAIVWRYNRGLAKRSGRARSGWFHKLHARGGWWVGGAYVLICLAYGEIVTTERDSRGLMSILLAIGFTSTLLHYYFDGFIWKIRHQQNREGLELGTAGEGGGSWWTTARTLAPSRVLQRQVAYFGIPMTVLTIGAVSVWSAPNVTSIDSMQRAQALSRQGDDFGAVQEATRAFDAMDRELSIATRRAEIDPSSAHQAELAFLIYNHSYYANVVLPSLAGHAVAPEAMATHRRHAAFAADALERAVKRGGELAHPGREHITSKDAERVVASWRRIARQT
jgi:hypothetical protein